MADIQDLLEELQKINIALKGGNLDTSRSNPSGEPTALGSLHSRKGMGAEIAEENKQIKEKIRLLLEEEEYRGRLS